MLKYWELVEWNKIHIDILTINIGFLLCDYKGVKKLTGILRCKKIKRNT